MSEMNYLDKLLDGVGVEWKALEDVAEYVRGLVYNKSDESSDGVGATSPHHSGVNSPATVARS